MTMPVLLVNMGGEMVYILAQRLQAQKIPQAKGQKVLSDVVRTMYYPRFIEELFKAQDMYSIQSTRQIFDRLAHSSIMRLNESSMDKLFDLMAMGFKYQIISCTDPQQLVEITQNHLENLHRLVGATPQLPELLDECVRQVRLAYEAMPVADMNAMRQMLCTFFQDRKVKVALFLNDKSQNPDGSLVVRSEGVLPAGAQVPGTVRYFDGGTEVRADLLPVVNAGMWSAPTGSAARTHLGGNLYESKRSGDAGAPGSPSGAPPAQEAQLAPAPTPTPEPATPSQTAAAAVGELNFLASLVAPTAAPSGETFKLESLFGQDMFSNDGSGGVTPIIQIDGSAPSEYRAGLQNVRAEMDAPEGQAGAPDDLLDLMDQAQP